jgi:hypothetical protein
VVLLERSIQRLRAGRCRRFVRDATDEDRQHHRDGFPGARLVGAELPAHLRESVALKLGTEIVEEPAHVFSGRVRWDGRATAWCWSFARIMPIEQARYQEAINATVAVSVAFPLLKNAG